VSDQVSHSYKQQVLL